MPTLSVDHGELYYERTGQGPALVFAHGLGGNYLVWWQQVAHFQDRYTCVTFSHRGFARSTEAPGSAGPDAFVDDLAALIDHLALDGVRLVAQSMGGWTCLGYALREPARVRALVMAATPGSLADPEIDRAYAARSGEAGELASRGIHPACGERMAREHPALHYLYQRLSSLNVDLDSDAVRRKLAALRVTTREQAAALPMPILCVSGEEDVVFPTAGAEAFAALVPTAKLERVPQAGHSVYFERPETFNRLLAEFLATAR